MAASLEPHSCGPPDRTWTASLAVRYSGAIPGIEPVGRPERNHGKLVDRVTLMEHTVTALPPRMDKLDAMLRELTKRVKVLEQHAEDTEGRSCRNNVRLVVLPEGTQELDPVQFIDTWMRTILPSGTTFRFSPLSEHIECRAAPPPTGAVPRPMVICFLHYRDRDMVIKETRSLGEVRVDSAKVMFFRDYTLAVQRPQ
ncbi:hypothetical protein NDU88_011823 [Pleurodeles waltl]|uniref:Uncharacterized protein n=1 Tax=Pleurodeles waltl TaxID=8319 RepID=A0AAV7R150_PLEWA|nr:hypothetical protein NDU88_011823 [Pleurodeles waltl]